ncbi:MAG: HesA/MoeB/ThiF family protein [Thermodesulfovibrionales bacterium]
MILSDDEIKRYHRQMLIEGWGQEGQIKLKNSKVFIAGAGGLGSPVAIYLAVAGVGQMTICDFDTIDLTNLNRQILHDHTRIGINKAISGKLTIENINPNIKVTAIQDRILPENADSIVNNADIIIDCMDNFQTRYVLNDTAIRKKIPLVFGSIRGMDGMLSFIQHPETPCLRCIFPESPPVEVFPVVGVTPGIIGTLQALESIKYLTGIGLNIKGRLLVMDGNKMEFRVYKVYKDPHCTACGGKN